MQPILDQAAGDRVERGACGSVSSSAWDEEPVAVEPAGVLELAVIDRDLGGQGLRRGSPSMIEAGNGQGCEEW